MSYLYQPTSPTILQLTNGEASPITQGQVVYVSGTNAVKLSRANAIGTSKMFGIVADASIAASAAGSIWRDGTVSIPQAARVQDWTAGDQIWISPDTAGLLTNVQPTTAGQYVVVVGWVLVGAVGAAVAMLNMNRGDFVAAV